MPKTQYQIHNTSKDVRTRLARRVSPGNPKTSLQLAGGSIRVLRGRPYPIAYTALQRLVPELLKLEARGFAKVTTLLGACVDLTTLKPVEALKVAPSKTPAVKTDGTEDPETSEESGAGAPVDDVVEEPSADAGGVDIPGVHDSPPEPVVEPSHEPEPVVEEPSPGPAPARSVGTSKKKSKKRN